MKSKKNYLISLTLKNILQVRVKELRGAMFCYIGYYMLFVLLIRKVPLEEVPVSGDCRYILIDRVLTADH